MAGMADSENPVTGPEDFSTDAGELVVGYKFVKSVGDMTVRLEMKEIVAYVNENSERLFGEALKVFVNRSSSKATVGRRAYIELRCSNGYDHHKYKKPASGGLVRPRLTYTIKGGRCSFQVRIKRGTTREKNNMVKRLLRESAWKTAKKSNRHFDEQKLVELRECMLRPSLFCEPFLLLTFPLRRCGDPACVGSLVFHRRAFGPLQEQEEDDQGEDKQEEESRSCC